MSLVTDEEWAEYKSKFNKNYEDAVEDRQRRDLYEQAKKRIAEHNAKFEAGEVTWKMAINHLADATAQEMAARSGRPS